MAPTIIDAINLYPEISAHSVELSMQPNAPSDPGGYLGNRWRLRVMLRIWPSWPKSLGSHFLHCSPVIIFIPHHQQIT